MSALRSLATILPVPTPPVAAGATQAQAGQPGQTGASDFAGIFDAAATSAIKDADAPALQGMAKRNRKSSTDDSSANANDAGTGAGAGSRMGDGQSAGTTVSLDIAALAQMAATLTPATPQPTGGVPADAASGVVAQATSKTAVPGASARQEAMAAGGTLPGQATVGAGTPTSSSALPQTAARAIPLSAKDQPAAPPQTAANGGAAAGLNIGDKDSGPVTPPPPGSTDAPPVAASPAQAAPTKGQAATQAEAASTLPARAATDAAAPAGSGTSTDPKAPKAAAPIAPEPGKASPQGARPAPSRAASPGPSGQAGGRATGSGPALPDRTDENSGTTPPTADATAGLTTATATVGTVASPEAPVSPAQQVVTALQDLVSKPTAETPQARAATSAAAPVQAAVTTAPGVKTLTIQLDPGHLGPVSVTLRMKADAVDIQIAVSNPQALHLLERDRHVLAAAVEAMGGSGTALHVGKTDVQADGGASFSDSPFTPQGGGTRQDGSSDAASTGRGNRSTPRDTNPSDPDDPTAAPTASPTRARDGSLYL